MRKQHPVLIVTLIGSFLLPFASDLLASNIGIRPPLPQARVIKLTSETWIDAFDSLHAELSMNYAFTDWKQIDWASAYQEYRPRITAAAAAEDPMAYYLALREYIYTIPDGHTNLIPIGDGAEDLDGDVRYGQIGGDLGFALIKLDDGRFVARLVAQGSPAAAAGMETGAEVTEIDGVAIDAAVEQVPLTWAIAPPATHVIRTVQQGRFLGRAPVGVSVDIVFINPGEEEPIAATLTAVDDAYENLQETFLCEDLPPDVFFEILDTEGGPVGYVQVPSTGDEESDGNLLLAQFAGAIQSFVDEGVNGVIVDIRTNPGGLDRVAAHLPGHFYTEVAHYEYVSFLDSETGEFEVDPRFTLHTSPLAPSFGGPVIAMIGPCTASSGEGVAMAIQNLPQGLVVGSYGTYGSFGITGGVVEMPEGLAAVYAPGRSLDEHFQIQLDGDADLEGGVAPDIRVPLNDHTVSRLFIDGDDVALETAIDLIFNRPPNPRRPVGRVRPAG